eukprot:gene11014-14793_t
MIGHDELSTYISFAICGGSASKIESYSSSNVPAMIDNLLAPLGIYPSTYSIPTQFPQSKYSAFIRDVLDQNGMGKLYGLDVIQQIEVSQWISFVQQNHSSIQAVFPKLNAILLFRSYLVGQALTIADIAVFNLVLSLKEGLESLSTYAQLNRWFNHIQSITNKNKQNLELEVKVIPAKIYIPIPSFQSILKGDVKSQEKLIVEDSNKKDNISVLSTSVDSKDKKSKDDSKTVKESKLKEAAKDNANEHAVSSEENLDPSKLEIKCGYVVKCWDHPSSDKLLCEEIDLGEPSGVRTIASGLRPHYAASDLQGKYVLVLANLKERAMAGFKSQGMVLCAVSKDHSVIKLLQPPNDAKIGDRVTFEGFNGDPAPPAHMTKKKIFENLAPFLHTDSNGNAHWKDIPFKIGSTNCIAPVFDAIVS